MPDYFTPAMTAYVYVVVFCLGACLGCFLDCAAGRTVRHQDFLRGRSHCDACGATLTVLDLIPILSWLFLRGKCRRCGAGIGLRPPVVETLAGAVLLSLVWRFGIAWKTLELALLGCVLLYLALVDLDTMELPDLPMLLAAAGWLVFSFADPQPLRRLGSGLLAALLIGGGVLAVTLVMERCLGREALGGGDVKLLALLALYLGPAASLLLLIVACLLGLALAALWRVGRGREFPFGPAIALAAWPTLLFSQPILSWYLGLF